MRRFFSVLAFLAIFLSLAGCGQRTVGQMPATAATTAAAQEESPVESGPTETENRILVVSFSCTGNTLALARYAADYLNADLYEILPEVPYTAEDIAYNNSDCRANLEQADETSRPAISGETLNLGQYDTVILSFPIWWGKEPRILDTFMESYDFSGKTMAAFCTSGSSGIGTAEYSLKAMAGDRVTWLGAERFADGTSKETMTNWLDQIGL